MDALINNDTQTKLNCEVLYDKMGLEVRWAIAGDSIVIQLVGKIDSGQYVSFGLSGDESKSLMVGGDVVVGWFDRATGRANVIDYYIDSKSQCSGRHGVCPDSTLKGEGHNNVRLLSGSLVNEYTMLTFQRGLAGLDELDKGIRTNGSESVIWAVGPLNQRNEPSYHSLRNRDDIFIDFGRSPKWNCPSPPDSKTETSTKTPPQITIERESPPPPQFSKNEQISKIEESGKGPWRVPPILCNEPEDRVFYAQMGPTGGKRGYTAITGKVGWGIAWYINGLLVPEVHLVRGKTYTFVVEGGDDPEVPAKYHPFYITDDPEGGYEHKSPPEKAKVKVFAGINGSGTGRLCQWQENLSQPADSFASYGAYQRSLTLECDDGHPGIVHWTPDKNTPDTVYYQCYTHRYLGWKIRILDSCEEDEVKAEESSLIISKGEENSKWEKGTSQQNSLLKRNGSLAIQSSERIDTHSVMPPAPAAHITQLHYGKEPEYPRQEMYSSPPKAVIYPPQSPIYHISTHEGQVGRPESSFPTQFIRRDGISGPQTYQIIETFPPNTFYKSPPPTKPPIHAYPIRYEGENIKIYMPQNMKNMSPPNPRPLLWPSSRKLTNNNGEESSIEIVKINDTDRLPFLLPQTDTYYPKQRLISGQELSRRSSQQQQQPLHFYDTILTPPKKLQYETKTAQVLIPSQPHPIINQQTKRLAHIQGSEKRVLVGPAGSYIQPQNAGKIERMDDGEIVYIKTNGEREEFPNILHKLDQDAENKRRRHDHVTHVVENEDHTSPQNLISQRHRRVQNNTDLHILTDIWSIINNKEEKESNIGNASQVSQPTYRLAHIPQTIPPSQKKQIFTYTSASSEEFLQPKVQNGLMMMSRNPGLGGGYRRIIPVSKK